MALLSVFNAAGIPVGYGLASGQAPKAMSLGKITFAAAGSFDIDLSQYQEADRLRMCQSMWIDNTANPNVLTLTIAGTGQVMKFAPSAAFYTPVLMPVEMQFNLASAGAGSVIAHCMNFPMGYARLNLV